MPIHTEKHATTVNIPNWIWYVALLAIAAIACVAAAQLGVKGVAVVVAACGVVWSLFKPEWLTLAIMFAIYSNAVAVATKFHNMPFLIAATVPLMLVVPIGYHVFCRGRKIWLPMTFWLVVAFVIVQFIGALLSDLPGEALSSALSRGLLEGLLIYFLVINAVTTPRQLQRVVVVLLIAGAFLSSIGLFQRVTETYRNDYGGFAQINRDVQEKMAEDQGYQPEADPRQSGSIGEENRYAQILLMLMPLGFFQFRGADRPVTKFMALSATGLIAIGIALSQSRGALVGFALVVIVMAAMQYVRWKHVVGLVLAGMLIVALFPSYRARLVSATNIGGLLSSDVGQSDIAADRAIMGRANEQVAAFLVFLDHPIIGVGPTMFAHHYQDYSRQAGFYQHDGKRASHNFFLGMAAEHGIIGLGLVLAILFITLRDLARCRRSQFSADPKRSDMAAAFFLVVVAYVGGGLFLHLAYVRYFWLMIALATVASRDDSIPMDASQRVKNR